MSKRFELRNRAAPARVAAATVIVVGLIAIAGWALGAPTLTRVIPGAVAMKINTALALVACGVALFLLAVPISHCLDRTAQALGLAAALLALLTLLEYFLGVDLRIDQLMIADDSHAYNVFRGRMSPFSAAAFLAVGAALATLPRANLAVVTRLGAGATLAIASLALLGYLWNAGEIVTDSVLPPVALNTAACFLLLGLGILLAPRRADLDLAERIGSLPSVEIQTLAGFGIALGFLLIGGGYTYRTSVELATSNAWVAHTQELRGALAEANGALAAAELAERDYLLTADAAHLAECRRSAAEARRQLENLTRLTADNPVQRHNVAVLEKLIEARLDEMQSGLEAFAANGVPAARSTLARTRDASITRLVPEQIGRMDALEAGYLKDRERSAARVGHSTLVSLVVTLLAASAAFAALFLRIHREMRARRNAENDLLETNRAVHQLNAALRANADQLKATNQELESFSYSVSHDLRAPLRAIDGFAMMIEEDCAERLDDRGRRYLSVIRENSRRMGTLIDDLLAFSRLGRLPVMTREIDVNSMVREVVAELLGPHGGARPRIDLGPLPPVQADPNLLRQVWANLLGNALKYSSKAEQPRIEISGRREGQENFYSVRDNGVGFDMAYADKLFGVFQRLHRADEFSGTGVGLAIVQRVVTRHGGRVWAESQLNRGAVFSFALPAGGVHGNA